MTPHSYGPGAARLAYAGLAAYLLAPLLAVIVAILVGCGATLPQDMSKRDRAQWIGSAAAEVVDHYDVQLARIYGDEADDCRASSTGWPDYDACIEPAERARRALLEARETLLNLQDSLDASTYGDSADIRHDPYRLAQCVGDAVARLALQLERFGVDPPPLVSQVVDAADTYTGGCREPEQLSSGGES